MFEVWVAIVSGVVGSGGLVGIVKLLERKSLRAKRDQEAKAEEGHQKILALQQEQNRHMESVLERYKSLITDFTLRIAKLEAQEAVCQERLHAAELQIQDLNDAVKRGNAPRLLAVIESDDKGTITGWNTAAQIIFGYMAEEVLGETVEMLTPPRLRTLHSAAFTKCSAEKRAPLLVAPLVSFGLNKAGEEVPITIFPTGWQHGDHWTYAAEIRLR